MDSSVVVLTRLMLRGCISNGLATGGATFGGEFLFDHPVEIPLQPRRYRN
jgi:hypothetical protein